MVQVEHRETLDFWIRQYLYNSPTFARHKILADNFERYFRNIILCIRGFYALFLRLGDFPRIVLSLSGVNILSSLPLYLLSFTLSLYAYPFHSLSIYPFHLSLSLSLISPSLLISLLLPCSFSSLYHSL